MSTHYGARPDDWRHLDQLGLGSDLLPVVSRPGATISPKSSMKQLGKTPSQYNGGKMVVGISRWTDHRASDAEIKRWASEPDYGICIQTRLVRALDIDVANEAVAAAIVKAAKQELGIDLPIRRRPNTGKCLLAFRLAGEFPKRVMKVEGGMIEFLGNGQQFIAVGTHTSGARYEWVNGLPETFPEITAQQFEDLWGSLEVQFAIEEPKEFKASDRRRGLHLDVDDPVATFLYDHGLVLGEDRRGGLLIECPWEHEHSGGDAGDSSTMWLIAGTNGHGQGHFRCLHSHCDHRTRQDYLAAINYQDDVANDFEDLGPDPDAETADGTGETIDAPAAARFEVIPAFMFLERPRPGWIIKGLIPKADLGVIYGESGAGKSFVMIDLAMAIARGTSWRGLKVRQGRVVYIVAEGGGGFRNRLEAYAQHNNVDLSQVPFGVVHAAPNLLDKAQVKALCQAILKAGAEVIVVDTFAQTTPGANENSAEDMGQAISNIRAVGRQAGAVVILVHHAGKDASRGARGWSGIKAAADFEIEVTRDGAARAVHTTKQKDGEDSASWGFTLQNVPIGMDDDGEVIESCVIAESEVQVEAGVRGGRRKAAAKSWGVWGEAILDVYQELAVGGDVLKSELVIRAADRRPDAGTVKVRRGNVRAKLAAMRKGDDSPFLPPDKETKEDRYVVMRD
jgi:hypothetical protein